MPCKKNMNREPFTGSGFKGSWVNVKSKPLIHDPEPAAPVLRLVTEGSHRCSLALASLVGQQMDAAVQTNFDTCANTVATSVAKAAASAKDKEPM